MATPGSLAKAVDQMRPDLLINAAAYTDVDKAESERELAFRINAAAAGEAGEASASIGVPIIQLSTDYVFDGQAREPYREDLPTAPISVYGASKLAGEKVVRAANPQHLIVRSSWLFSPFGRNFVRTMLNLAKDRAEIAVVDDQLGSPTSALDLASALAEIARQWAAGAETGMGRTYHVTNGGQASWFELATQVMAEARSRGLPSAHVRPIASAEWPAKAPRPVNSRLDSSRFAVDFGYALPDWRTALAATLDRIAQAN